MMSSLSFILLFLLIHEIWSRRNHHKQESIIPLQFDHVEIINEMSCYYYTVSSPFDYVNLYPCTNITDDDDVFSIVSNAIHIQPGIDIIKENCRVAIKITSNNDYQPQNSIYFCVYNFIELSMISEGSYCIQSSKKQNKRKGKKNKRKRQKSQIKKEYYCDNDLQTPDICNSSFVYIL